MKFVKLTLVSCALVGFLTAGCWAMDQDKTVPSDAKSAKDVVSQLKEKGATNIRSIEFDNHQWNVKTQHGQKETQFQIDAKSGNITKKHEVSEDKIAPPSNVLGILQVINIVERQGLHGIREVEYDDNLWKVEVVQDGKATKLHLNPIAGEVIWQDIKPIKMSDKDDDDSDDASHESKLDKIKGAIKERFMQKQSTQEPTSSGSQNQQPQQ